MINFKRISNFTFVYYIGIIIAAPTVKALEPIAPRPPTGIYDEADLLSEEQEAALAKRLRAALFENYLEVYLATSPMVKGEDIEARGKRIRNAWARNPHAIAAVYDESLAQLSFVGTRDLENFLSRPQLEAVFARAAERSMAYIRKVTSDGKEPDKSEILLSAIDGLLSDPILVNRVTAPGKAWFTKDMWLLLVGFVTLMLLAGGTVVYGERRLARTRQARKRVSYFPKTHMPIRLGGQFSGGSSATLETSRRNFSHSASKTAQSL